MRGTQKETTFEMLELTLCGKCGKNVNLCECAELAPAVPQTPLQKKIEKDLNLPGFRTAMRTELEKHKVKPDEKRELCKVCKALGSTFGCLKCSGIATIRW